MKYKKENNIVDGQNNPKINSYITKCQNEIRELEESFKKSTELLIASYEEYLSHINPSPKFLPVNVTIKILDKGVEMKNVRIDRATIVGDLKKIVATHMENIGNPITEFQNANVFVLYKSFSSMNDIENNLNDGILLIDESIPILQHNPQPGSLILLKGKLYCQSDAPKQCFKSTFKPGLKMDYFSCINCNQRWICRPCIEECHKGHQVKSYIRDHNAEWACCYCFKKRQMYSIP